jgi:ribonucleotide reductase beta subunit family protein with ferritin-like domain
MSIFKVSKQYRPFEYPWAAEAAKKHTIDMFWDVHQVELADDLRQYMAKDGLNTKNFTHAQNKDKLDKLMCVFTEMDRTVAGGYKKLLSYIDNNEISNLLLIQGAREVTHQRGYALGPETFGVTDDKWGGFISYKEMQDKLDIMAFDLSKPEYSKELNAMILLAQILLGEGIGLFAAFSSLLNYKRYGLMMGYNDINQWSLVDEQEHVINNIKVLLEGRKELTELENMLLDEAIESFIAAYTAAEIEFVHLLHSESEQEDLTSADLVEYIHYLGDFRRYQLKMCSASQVRKNPLMWMEWMLSASKHDNFFEKRVTAYSHSRLIGEVDYSKYADLLTPKFN